MCQEFDSCQSNRTNEMIYIVELRAPHTKNTVQHCACHQLGRHKTITISCTIEVSLINKNCFTSHICRTICIYDSLYLKTLMGYIYPIQHLLFTMMVFAICFAFGVVTRFLCCFSLNLTDWCILKTLSIFIAFLPLFPPSHM